LNVKLVGASRNQWTLKGKYIWILEDKQAIFYTRQRGVLLFMPITVQFGKLRSAGNVAGIDRQGKVFTALTRKILRKCRLDRSGSRWQDTLLLISA
jgi:hypothetical protein